MQHNDTHHNKLICYTQHEWHSAEQCSAILLSCRYAECRILFIIMLSVVKLNVLAYERASGSYMAVLVLAGCLCNATQLRLVQFVSSSTR